MEIEFGGKDIILKGKELDSLDRKVIKLVNLIDFEYVIISGYVAILFGRSILLKTTLTRRDYISI
jgi:hypothetical protein